jgi:cell division protein FtsB
MKLGVGSKTNSDMDALKAENDELQKRVKDLESQIDDLKARLKTFSEESPS